MLDKDMIRRLEDGKMVFLESEYGQHVLKTLQDKEEYYLNRLVDATDESEIRHIQGQIVQIRRTLALLNLTDL